MNRVLQYMPFLEGDEMMYVSGLVKDLNDGDLQQFAGVYGSRRKDPLLILITSAIGFLGVAGIQRFILGQIGMGILYLLTAGLCFIGTIIDMVNFRSNTFQYNQRVAYKVYMLVKPQGS